MAKRVTRPTSAAPGPEPDAIAVTLFDVFEAVHKVQQQQEAIMSRFDQLQAAVDELKNTVGNTLQALEQSAADQQEIDKLEQEVYDLTNQLKDALGGQQGGDQGGGGQQGGDQGGGGQQGGQQPGQQPGGQQPAQRSGQPGQQPGQQPGGQQPAQRQAPRLGGR